MDEKIFQVNHAELFATAVKPEQFPTDGLPEFVFAGRSNVGKSSLINTMANRKALARTSGSPGKTRTLNFYKIEKRLYFVDLPGYGYARVSRSESEKWGQMIERYLKDRPQIRRVILLLDIRHEPTAGDRQLLEWLGHYGFPLLIVATKSDKLKRSQVPRRAAELKALLGSPVIPFSSESRDGRERLWEIITAEVSDL